MTGAKVSRAEYADLMLRRRGIGQTKACTGSGRAPYTREEGIAEHLGNHMAWKRCTRRFQCARAAGAAIGVDHMWIKSVSTKAARHSMSTCRRMWRRARDGSVAVLAPARVFSLTLK